MEKDQIDLRAYGRVLRRWWWLATLGVVIAGGTGYVISRATTPIYESSVTILVQGNRFPGLPTASDLEASDRLARNFIQLVTTRRNVAEIALRLELSEEDARAVTAVAQRSAIIVSALSPDAQRAADIANTAAEIFIEDFQRRQFAQIAQFQAGLNRFGVVDDDLIIAAQASALSTLEVIEPAQVPSVPIRPRTRLNVLLASVLGLLVAVVAIVFAERLDDTIKLAGELNEERKFSAQQVQVATLASVLRMPGRPGKRPLILEGSMQRSPLAEAYRFLRLNLEFATLRVKDLQSILVTSPRPGEGKTTTAVNLAITWAQAGKSTILVDGDLRKPAMKELFGLDDRPGLSHVLSGTATLEEALAPTWVEGLRVLSTGALPPDPSLVLRSPEMREVIRRLEEESDMVIFDSPPLLSVTDATLLALLVDGVLLVVAASQTRREELSQAVAVIDTVGVPIVGAVLNKVEAKTASGYYYAYYGEDSSDRHEEDGHSQKGRLPGLRTLTSVFGWRPRRRRKSDVDRRS